MIKRVSLLMMILLKLYGGYSQSDTYIVDHADYVKSIFKDSLITENRVGGFNLGFDMSVLQICYSFVEDKDEYYLKLHEGLLLSLWSMDDKTVGGIAVYSPNFKTINGLFVGSEIKDVLKIYPDIKINLSEETEEEYFSIGSYIDNNENIFLLYVESLNGDKLGKNYQDDFGPETDDFNREGKVTKIEIFTK